MLLLGSVSHISCLHSVSALIQSFSQCSSVPTMTVNGRPIGMGRVWLSRCIHSGRLRRVANNYCWLVAVGLRIICQESFEHNWLIKNKLGLTGCK